MAEVCALRGGGMRSTECPSFVSQDGAEVAHLPFELSRPGLIPNVTINCRLMLQRADRVF